MVQVSYFHTILKTLSLPDHPFFMLETFGLTYWVMQATNLDLLELFFMNWIFFLELSSLFSFD
jgi:hypothetical protein